MARPVTVQQRFQRQRNWNKRGVYNLKSIVDYLYNSGVVTDAEQLRLSNIKKEIDDLLEYWDKRRDYAWKSYLIRKEKESEIARSAGEK